MSRMKKKKGPAWWLGLAILIAAVFGAWHLSFVPINLTNDAKGFDGDSRKSLFLESDKENTFFSAAERMELTRAIQEMSRKLQMNIVVFASRISISDDETKGFVDESYDELFGADTDGVFYYLDMSGKRPAFDYLSTSGKAVVYYEEAREDIFSELDKYLPSSADAAQNGYEPYRENIKKAVHAFLNALDYHAEHCDSEGYYFQSPNTGKYVYFLDGTLYVTTSRPPRQKFYLMLFALLIGFIASKILDATVRRGYVFVDPVDADIYVSNENVEFTEATDTFVREHTARRSHSSSSSGGGGGGRSSGGSHGGGGHHR